MRQSRAIPTGDQYAAGSPLSVGLPTTFLNAQALRIATVQMVFQDPQSALNPTRRVASIVTQAMEAGSRHATWEEIIEHGRTDEIFANRTHPYTRPMRNNSVC